MNNDSTPITVVMEQPLHLTSRGAWLHGGEPFTNDKVSDLFTRSVVFDAIVGSWWVVIGAQRAKFTFDDTPIFVTTLDDAGVATFSVPQFGPLSQPGFSISSSSDGVWYLSAGTLPCLARFNASLQQQLSGLVDECDLKAVIKLPKRTLEIRYDRR